MLGIKSTIVGLNLEKVRTLHMTGGELKVWYICKLITGLEAGRGDMHET